MGADLNNIVKCQKLTDDHVQFLIYQILRGLKVQPVTVSCGERILPSFLSNEDLQQWGFLMRDLEELQNQPTLLVVYFPGHKISMEQV